MSKHEETTDVNEESGALSRRGLFVSGGLLTASMPGSCVPHDTIPRVPSATGRLK